jgi:hypothetical protein
MKFIKSLVIALALPLLQHAVAAQPTAAKERVPTRRVRAR